MRWPRPMTASTACRRRSPRATRSTCTTSPRTSSRARSRSTAPPPATWSTRPSAASRTPAPPPSASPAGSAWSSSPRPRSSTAPLDPPFFQIPEKPMKTALKLQLDEARLMVRAALVKAQDINVLETICITDEGGFPLVMERMDGARVTGPQIAWNKAFGIQWSFEGKFAVFVGGFPIVVNGEVVGGVGLSGGNGEQDTACGLAALQALKDALAASGHEVMVQADIKK